MKRRIFFYTVVLLQTIFLLGMVYKHQEHLNTGFPIRLKVIPVDPQDVMRGEYVRLGFEISQLDLIKMKHDSGNYDRGTTVYIVLSKDTQPESILWNPQVIRLIQPELEYFPFIKGEIQWHEQHSSSTSRISNLHVKYAIEQYYVQQGRAQEIESAITSWEKDSTSRVSAEIRLDKKGKPLVSKIFIDNREFR